MSNYYVPYFYRIEFVDISFYIELSWIKLHYAMDRVSFVYEIETRFFPKHCRGRRGKV